MGFDTNGVQYLLHARRAGVDFTSTAMIGRQILCLEQSVMDAHLRDFGYPDATIRVGGFAEEFLSLLGAQSIVSFDISPDESPTLLRDFNYPFDLDRQFTAVVESGTLEHIFNFPVAIDNCRRLVSLGGHYLGNTPTEGLSGHGLYQFSPDLLYRCFSPSNGFRMCEMFASTDRYPWSLVPDPLAVGRRVELATYRTTYLMFRAEKVSERLLIPIQQSEYTCHPK